ncbi:hypothetical protein H2200_003372 [Cladophialophora chaetospira]|uniref:Uncharacterized protein n=1 Tax=Cladophialophora chaetospira TaxID=386627 RepID=A0AA39CM78_9EURO|nr:hypothetical protein H2200_003372 [Cladophialophora chaetospira]
MNTSASTAQCYSYSSGEVAEWTYIPCNPAGGDSMCCRVFQDPTSRTPDSCLPNGLCSWFDRNAAEVDQQQFWIESCSDPNWEAPACAVFKKYKAAGGCWQDEVHNTPLGFCPETNNYCCNQNSDNTSCCDTSVSEHLFLDLPIASMIPVTTSFSGSLYTTVLPTLMSNTISTSTSTTTGNLTSSTSSNARASTPATSALPTTTSSIHDSSSKHLSAGAGIGIGIAASLVLVAAVAGGYKLLRRSRRKRALPQYEANEDPEVTKNIYPAEDLPSKSIAEELPSKRVDSMGDVNYVVSHGKHTSNAITYNSPPQTSPFQGKAHQNINHFLLCNWNLSHTKDSSTEVIFHLETDILADERMAQATDLVEDQALGEAGEVASVNEQGSTSGNDLHQEFGGMQLDSDDNSSNSIISWYESIPPPTGPAKRYNKNCGLGKCPPEIRDQIWELVLGGRHEIDITIRIYDQGFVRSSPSVYFWEMLNIANTCRSLRTEMFRRMQEYITFTHYCPTNFGSTIKHVPHTILRRIRTFHLYCDGYLDRVPEIASPKVLALISNHMPQLVRFQVKSSYSHGIGYGVQLSHAERQRAILRFGAFLIAKMKEMDMLIWPGDSGPTYEPGRDRTMYYVEVASSKYFRDRRLYRAAVPKYLNEKDAEEDVLSLVEDRLLNSTVLRRLHWDDLLEISIDDLTLDRTMHDNSEVNEGDAHYFFQVDNEGYVTKERRRKLGKPFIPVDRLIDICENRKRKAIQNGTYRSGIAPSRPPRGHGRGRASGRGRGGRATAATQAGVDGTNSSNSHVVHANAARGRGNGRGRGVGRGRGAYGGTGAQIWTSAPIQNRSSNSWADAIATPMW